MNQQLKKSFFQVFTVTCVWVTFILTMFFAKGQMVSINYLWNIIGVSVISASLFGVMYTALWNHFTLKPIWNVLIATVANTVGGFTVLWLISKPMFHLAFNWVWGVLLLTLVLHTIAFYFYAKFESNKQVEALNQIL